MASVYKRKSDRARGKAGKWTACWIDEAGKPRQRAAYVDKAKSQELANHLEAEARRVREGIVDPGERARRAAVLRPLADHINDYKLDLLSKGDTTKHAKHVAGALRRLCADASVTSVAEIAPDRIQAALGRLKVARSSRTANHALAAVKAFARWLADSGRIQEVPRGLRRITPYPEESDRKRVRRALSIVELARLLEAAQNGPTVVTRRDGRGGPIVGTLTGPERAILYRIAMATGFRAEEIRTLTPEQFALEGDEPTITVLACYSKRGKHSGRDDTQPIRRDVAEVLRPWLEGKPPGEPVLAVPEKTAKLLRGDLAAAKIPVKDAKGRVLDFHALRHSYITHLVKSGVNVKVVQKLARHSTITLTLDRYCSIETEDTRNALETPTNSDISDGKIP